MNHYFTNNPDAADNRKTIGFRFLSVLETFISDDNVFSKETLDFGSRALLETLMKEEIHGRVLDLGCGYGPIGILLKKYKEIDLCQSDINERAVELARLNGQRYQQNNEVIVSDGFENIAGSFDAVVTNPPIRTGKQNIYRMFKESVEHLNQGGKLYLVIRKQQGAESTVKYLQTLSDSVKVLEKISGYWIIKLMKND